jgi:uncharacterized ion transporter superfamily protein YfcC
VNIPLPFLMPSSSGHAALAMLLLSPLAYFAGVSDAPRTPRGSWLTA